MLPNLTNQYISYSMAVFSANEIRTFFLKFPIFFYPDDEDKGPDCWICYDPDRNDCGPMIHPCDCRGDVGAVHHDCLRRWLVEVKP